MQFVKGWNLVRNPEEWAEYRAAYALSCGWDVSNGSEAGWGGSPLKYPAMVCTYSPTPFKAISAYFYEDEASLLMAIIAASALRIDAADLVVPASAALDLAKENLAKLAVSASQGETNRHVAASLLTLVQILVANGSIKQETYERKLTANLSAVDGWILNQHRATIAAAVEQAECVLPKVLPDKNEK